MPKYPDINTKQLTPIIEKLSIINFHQSRSDNEAILPIGVGNPSDAPSICTTRISSILTMRNNSIFDCRCISDRLDVHKVAIDIESSLDVIFIGYTIDDNVAHIF